MSTAPLDLLRQYLETVRDSGRTHLSVSSDSMQLLAGLRSKAERQLDSGVSQIETMAEEEADAKNEPAVEEETKAQKLARVRSLAEAAPEARRLKTLRDKMVFAVGDPGARLMLIGEAPGYQEEKQGEPFVGPAGEKLNLILKAMGLSRSAVYISNVCKFRPAIEGKIEQGTENRKPTGLEMRSCLPFLKAEIEIVQPVCIVALGATAAEGLGLTGAVGKLRGRVHEVDGTPMIVTYHPSYILREEREEGGIRVKRQVWEDMMAAMEVLGMPISEKQKAFFKVS